MKIFKTSDTHRGFSQSTVKIHKNWAENIAKEEFDVLVLAGDMASHRKIQFLSALKFWRAVAGDRPIVLSRGNHDLWESGQRNLHALRNILHHEWFEKYKIHHLESAGPLYIDKVCFSGFDGWYNFRIETNDLHHISKWHEGDTWGYLQKCAAKGFDAMVLASETAKANGYKVVGVTHFPIVPNLTAPGWSGNMNWWEIIAPHLDAFCYGHSHKPVNQIVDGVLVINSGSDYDKPKYTIFEV